MKNRKEDVHRNANRPGGPIPRGRFAALMGNYASNRGNAKYNSHAKEEVTGTLCFHEDDE